MPIQDKQRESLVRRIYNINEQDFDSVALDVWHYQYQFNPVYQSYCLLLGVSDKSVQTPEDIPFLPVSAFKNREVKTGQWDPVTVFRSSGTTAGDQSNHFIRDLSWYDAISSKTFSLLVDDPAGYVWIGLLPSYLERPDSSLVHMVTSFMKSGDHAESMFCKVTDARFFSNLEALAKRNSPVVLIGVSFALVDVFQSKDVPVWDQLLIMETGGMKGRGAEMTRDELYARLRMHYPELRIASEYGMTELMSQAYRLDDYFQPGPAMKVFIRDISDPLSDVGPHQRGGINVMDLANIDSCSFIATDDVGIAYPDGTFDVLGRMDNSDLRGCNLMYTSAGM